MITAASYSRNKMICLRNLIRHGIADWMRTTTESLRSTLSMISRRLGRILQTGEERRHGRRQALESHSREVSTFQINCRTRKSSPSPRCPTQNYLWRSEAININSSRRAGESTKQQNPVPNRVQNVTKVVPRILMASLKVT